MKALINNLKKANAGGKDREKMEGKIAENIKDAIKVPDFYKLDLEVLNEIFDKAGIIDIDYISTIVTSGYKYYGAKASVLLPHIKCGKLRKFNNNVKELEEAKKEIESILNEMDYIPIIREVKLAISEVLNGYKSTFHSEEEEGGIEVDWEGEYKILNYKAASKTN